MAPRMRDVACSSQVLHRRTLLAGACSGVLSGLLPLRFGRGDESRSSVGAEPSTMKPAPPQARIAITLDLEMSRNFPTWDATHWDYEKGNLNAETIRWSVEAARRVKERGGHIHFFVVGRVFEQQDVRWLRQLHEDGHRLGNHTYDHVNVLATKAADIQFRFQRAPWLIEGRSPSDVIRDNIRLTEVAMRERLGIKSSGFRTPGGFGNGLKERPDVQALLKDCGFTWVSSLYPGHRTTMAQTRPDDGVIESIIDAQKAAQPFRYDSGLLEIPMSPISDIGAFRTGRWKLDWFLDVLRQSATHCIEQSLVFDFLAHPSCLYVTDPEFRSIDLLCDLVEQSRGRAVLSTLDEIANVAIPG